MTKSFSQLNSLIWGLPMLVLILGVGIWLTIRLYCVQITLLPRALRLFWARLTGRGCTKEGISPYQALCTALAATVGTGNLVGVAGAICLGGPGAIFWMWVCGIIGMATKYAEATLAVHCRTETPEGCAGGPMYVIQNALGPKFRPLAYAYCLFGIAASFGVGNAAQVNAVITGFNGVLLHFGISPTRPGNLLLGLSLAIATGAMLLGGARRIGSAAEKLVPFAAGLYILFCLGILLLQLDRIPQAVGAIFTGAFHPKAVTGGLLGSAFQALRTGCSRGVFTNEAGMGTAAIAHAGANVSHPCEQGLMGIMEVFLDTILICSLTALVILVSGVPIPYGRDSGAELTNAAFSSVYGSAATFFLAAALFCFAVATILGWGLYGGRCAEFLFGSGAWKIYALAQTVMVVLSSALDTAAIWQLSEALNGLMAIPNLITLAALSPELARLTKEYRKSAPNRDGGGHYANFHQCKPLRTLSHAKVPSPGGSRQEGRQKNLPPEHRPARSSHP